MRYGGILVILLFLFVGCSAALPQTETWLTDSDRVFSHTEDPVLILTDSSPEDILQAIRQSYSSVQVDFQSDDSLYLTVFTQPTKRIVVVENDLDGTERYLIMITKH